MFLNLLSPRLLIIFFPSPSLRPHLFIFILGKVDHIFFLSHSLKYSFFLFSSYYSSHLFLSSISSLCLILLSHLSYILYIVVVFIFLRIWFRFSNTRNARGRWYIFCVSFVNLWDKIIRIRLLNPIFDNPRIRLWIKKTIQIWIQLWRIPRIIGSNWVFLFLLIKSGISRSVP